MEMMPERRWDGRSWRLLNPPSTWSDGFAVRLANDREEAELELGELG